MSLVLEQFKSSFETNHWSDKNSIWNEHFVENPRLPKKVDGEHDWRVTNYPSELSRFLGRQNVDSKNSLISLATDGRLRNVCVHGPSGSGKTALVKVFVKEFYVQHVEDGRISLKDCVYETTGDEVSQNMKKFRDR